MENIMRSFLVKLRTEIQRSSQTNELANSDRRGGITRTKTDRRDITTSMYFVSQKDQKSTQNII